MRPVNRWGCYDVKYLNAVMKIPQLAEIRVSLYDVRNKLHVEQFGWDEMKYPGTIGVAGSYFQLILSWKGFDFTLEFCGEGNTFVYKVIPSAAHPDYRFYIASLLRWGVSGTVASGTDWIRLETSGQTDIVTILGDRAETNILNTDHVGCLMRTSCPVYIRGNHQMNIQEMETWLIRSRDRSSAELVRSGGYLEDSCQAIIKGILWNTFYDPNLKDLCTVISRKWCNGFAARVFGSYILADWDTFLAGLLSGIQDKELAYQQVYSILGQATEQGFVPNLGSQRGKTEDRSQPPVGAYCVYRLYCQFAEKRLLQDTWPALIRWHRWWWRERDGNGDGLLEWGSNPFEEGVALGFDAHNLISAKLESGLDNSPMYDQARFNQERNTMQLNDVGLNSLIALDAWALSRIAGEIGLPEQAEELGATYQRLKRTINEQLWNEERGIYLNRDWDGAFSLQMSPTCFYPMIAGIASEKQVSRMIDEHLLNPREFWGHFVIPSTPRNEGAFADQVYWRGRIWGPMNFLVGEGLKRYGRHETAYALARKSLGLFRQEWKDKAHIHENYHADSGAGCDVPSSDPFYHWGGLLAYLAVSEVIEVQPWAGLRFGNLQNEPCSVEHFPIHNDRYSVYIDNGLTIRRNGQLLLEATRPVLITGYGIEEGVLRFDLKAAEATSLIVYETHQVRTVRIRLPEGLREFETEGTPLVIHVSGPGTGEQP